MPPSPTALSSAALPALASSVPVPGYDRSALRVGIVHIGVGGFHRAHQAMYLDRLMSQGLAHDWAICGVGVLPHDRRMKDALKAQDGLYTLVLKHSDGSYEPRVIGSIVDFLLAPEDPEAVLATMAAPQTRIVSLTVTEGGYLIDHVSGHVDAKHPAIAADAAPEAVPQTAFGLIVEALARRRAAGTDPFTVMSCDNIPGNGDVAAEVIGAFARARDPELADWIGEHVTFPNSMVDRITPVTTDDDRAEVTERFGIVDQWPVVCEPFTQWVLEDNFSLGRPPYEEAGVQVVSDVEPYELMKLRLLNAGHQGLCYFGYLAGYRLVHEVCQDELFADFLLSYMDNEAIPTLPAVPGIDLHGYARELIARFCNPHVRDTVARLCAESSDRIPKWLLPVIRLQLDSDGPITMSTAIVASWARYAEGTDEDGKNIDIVDHLAERVRANAAETSRDPLAFVSDRGLFGDLVDDERFTATYASTMDSLHQDGSLATLRTLLRRD